MAEDPAFVWDSGREPPPVSHRRPPPEDAPPASAADQVTDSVSTPSHPSPEGDTPPEVPLQGTDVPWVEAPPPPPPPQEEETGPADTTAPGDGVLVPVDEWRRIVRQLGNLHEAGQQLADARERAAKAETEAVFLRERLGEMRETIRDLESPPPPPPEPPVPSFWVWALNRLGRRRPS